MSRPPKEGGGKVAGRGRQLLYAHLQADTRFTSIDGQDRSQPLPYDPNLPVEEQVKQSVARSLENLRVQKIDSVLLHSPMRRRDVSTAFRLPKARVPKAYLTKADNNSLVFNGHGRAELVEPWTQLTAGHALCPPHTGQLR